MPSIYPRTRYEMTPEDLAKIIQASRPTPAMFVSGGVPIGGTPQENANNAWAELGKRIGFDWETVQPTGEGGRFFTAVPSETPEQAKERKAREAIEAREREILTIRQEIGKLEKRLQELMHSSILT